MNFVRQWSVQHNSDALFWEIAIPIMIVITPMFMWSDIQKAYHFIDKKMISNKAIQVCLRPAILSLSWIEPNRCISGLKAILYLLYPYSYFEKMLVQSTSQTRRSCTVWGPARDRGRTQKRICSYTSYYNQNVKNWTVKMIIVRNGFI